MAKEAKHGLPQTKGDIQLKGVVTGVEKEGFFKEIITRSGKPMYFLNFGLEVDKGKVIHLSLQAMKPDTVFFYKKAEQQGEKGIVERVAYENCKEFQQNNEGFSIIGKSVGLDKNEEGKNDIKYLCDFDAVRYLKSKLSDGMSLTVFGEIDFSSYVKEGKTIRATKFVPSKIFATQNEIDFNDENFEPKAVFSQQVIVKEYGNNDNGDLTVQAQIVNYSSIEDTEFIIRKENKLGNTLRKNVKPFTTVRIHGNIEVSESVQVVVVDDEWGMPDPTKSVSKPTKRELVVTGADPATVDEEIYSEEKMTEAIKKLTVTETASQDWGSKSDESWGDDW